MDSFSLIQKLAVWVIPLVLAITLHEAAHAWAAYRCGDTTAKMLGRLSANPMVHIDLFGTLLIPLMIAVFSGFNFIFGWAKPVPINPNNMKNPRRDTALVTAAGPAANIIMALAWALILKLTILIHPKISTIALFLVLMARAGITINLVLAILNLLPIPPLDGSKIVNSLLPLKHSITYMKIEPYGFMILLVMLFTGILGAILSPMMQWSLQLIKILFNF